MPGIVGVVSRRPAYECEPLVRRMLASMLHESFYVTGTSQNTDVGVYSGWVAHKSSFAAAECCRDEKDVSVSFAGECYSDSYKSVTDRYRDQGEAFIPQLNGLFGGLIIDHALGAAILFNDRYGIERLYVHESNGEMYFASEAKALLAVLPELRAFDEAGVTQYLAYGCISGERTLFRGISVLPGGSKWTVASGEVRIKARYFRPNDWEAQAPLTGEHFMAKFSATFQRILARYSEHEESVGIALTGGLDTRMVMACLPETETRHPCYTFVGETGLTLDARLATQIADVKGLKHQVLRIKPDFLRDFGSYLDRTITATDGCAGAIASHEIYFNARARELSPIRLTGNFGSEIFRSVSTFKPLGLQRALLSDQCAEAVATETRQPPSENIHPVTFAAFHEIPRNLYGLLSAGRSQLTFRTPYLDNELVALVYRAPVALRRSTLPALHLIEQANPRLARIPTDRGEVLGRSGLGRLLRRALGKASFKLDYYNSEGLPRGLSLLDPALHSLSSSLHILGSHKYLPYRHWFRKELAPLVIERASSRRVREAPWWAKNAPEMLARAHVSGRGNYHKELNAVLSLEAIDRLFFSGKRAEMPEQRQRVIEVAG